MYHNYASFDFWNIFQVHEFMEDNEEEYWKEEYV